MTDNKSAPDASGRVPPGTAIRRPASQVVIYDVLRVAARLAATLVYQIRVTGRENYPPTGGGLVCANHQSHLDPVIIGLTVDRRLNYLARKSLFKFGPFRWLIEFFDAIPLDREGLGIAGIKETIKRLRGGELVLMFPEGARTFDGDLGPLLPGFVTLARRTRVPLVPVALDGAFDAWPRTRPFPLPGIIDISIGPPIEADQLGDMTDEQLLEELRRRIQQCLNRARHRRRRARPAPPPSGRNQVD